MISYTFRTSQKNWRKADISILNLYIGKQNEEKPRFQDILVSAIYYTCYSFLLRILFPNQILLKIFSWKFLFIFQNQLLDETCSLLGVLTVISVLYLIQYLSYFAMINRNLSFRNALVFNNNHKNPISSPFYRIRTSERLHDLLKITWLASDGANS